MNSDLPNGLNTYTTTTQSVGASTTVYVTNSGITVPASGLAVGTMFLWRLFMTKTAAGTTGAAFIIYAGTDGTTSDTAEVTSDFTGTAIADTCYVDIVVIVQGTLGSSCQAQWMIGGIKGPVSGAGTGFFNGPGYCQSGTFTFNSSTSGLIFGLGLNTGGGYSITINACMGEVKNLGG